MSGEDDFHGLSGIFTREVAPLANFGFEPSDETAEYLADETRVLCVGAGGLGCELLKGLALSGFRDIYVIDMDTIDVSNLNRQFLFRKRDVGRYKSEVAAEFIMRRCPQVKVKHFTKKIQEFDASWYAKFNVVIAGLDNVEARRWLNATLNELVKYDENGHPDMSTVIPLIDGGTEGFRGQSRLFYPRVTSCFDCVPMPAAQNHFHLCTLAAVPRIPEHCIAYVMELQWPLLEEFKTVDDYKLYKKRSDDDEHVPSGVKLDKDSPQHMSWIYNRALERAKEFNIPGVTYKLTMQVVKNIIPAIASTNALISAQCVGEALKAVTFASLPLNNFNQYNGANLQGCVLHEVQKNPSCGVCCSPAILKVVAKKKEKEAVPTLQDLMDALVAEHKYDSPSVTLNDGTILYLATMHESKKANLAKPLTTWFKKEDGEFLVPARVSGKGKKKGTFLVSFKGM